MHRGVIMVRLIDDGVALFQTMLILAFVESFALLLHFRCSPRLMSDAGYE